MQVGWAAVAVILIGKMYRKIGVSASSIQSMLSSSSTYMTPSSHFPPYPTHSGSFLLENKTGADLHLPTVLGRLVRPSPCISRSLFPRVKAVELLEMRGGGGRGGGFFIGLHHMEVYLQRMRPLFSTERFLLPGLEEDRGGFAR